MTGLKGVHKINCSWLGDLVTCFFTFLVFYSGFSWLKNWPTAVKPVKPVTY